MVGQGVNTVGTQLLMLPKEEASSFTCVVMIFLGALLTGLGIYDVIGKHAGAGSIVPITGFANAVASPAIDSHSEGLILGVGAKIFSIAGPVILYGAAASVIYGLIYWIMKMR